MDSISEEYGAGQAAAGLAESEPVVSMTRTMARISAAAAGMTLISMLFVRSFLGALQQSGAALAPGRGGRALDRGRRAECRVRAVVSTDKGENR
jgi:hypothetical protein